MKIQKIKARSYSYGGWRPLSAVKYIVIHYTGISGDTAVSEGKYFAHTNTRSAGAHFFVDRAGNVVESVPMTLTAWSVGGYFTQQNGAGEYYRKCTNANSVSIELCDIAKKNPSSAQIKACRELVAYIKRQCPNVEKIIRHWDVNGKQCPARMVNATAWKKFLSQITDASYLVKITKDTPIKSGAGAKYRTVGEVKAREVYTITKQKGTYGKLKSGAGWINISDTTKVS